MFELLSVSSLQISVLEISYSKIYEYIQPGTKTRPNMSLHYVGPILIDTERKEETQTQRQIFRRNFHFSWKVYSIRQ